jgi:hypothetical protein
MIRKTILGFATAIAFVATATVAGAAGPGGMGGGGVGGMHGMGAMGAVGSFGPVNVNALNFKTIPRGGGGGSPGTLNGTMNGPVPFPTNEPEHYHEIKRVGRVVADGSGLTIDQQIVRMRVDGRTIPMSINGDATSNSLQFDQGDEQGQNLYRLIVSRQLEVVGDQKLRTQIMTAAAANPAHAKPIQVDGYVYDRMTPYLVLVSVGDAP